MRYSEFSGEPNKNCAHEGPLTVDGTARLLSSLLAAGFHAATEFVVVSIEDAELRYTVNGTTPTATLGRRGLQDGELTLSRAEADACKMIRTTATSAKIQVMQYRR